MRQSGASPAGEFASTRAAGPSERSQERRRVLYLSVYDPRVPLTGAGTRGRQFVKHFSSRYELDLLFMEGSGQPPDPELTRLYADGFTGPRSIASVDYSPFRYFLFSPGLYGAAAERLEHGAYDFMICDYGLSAVYGVLLSRRFGIPFVYCSHNLEFRTYLEKAKKDPRRLPLAGYVYVAEKLAVKGSSVLVPITQGDAASYERWTDREKMVVVPQGFDPDVLNPYYERPNNDVQRVLFCGNYNIRMNRDVVRVMIDRVIPEVVRRRPDTIFRFVGANPPRHLRHPTVEYTGFIEDYPDELKRADVVTSPIMEGAGFPTKIVEALACGKPTISTPVGARAVERDYRTFEVCDLSEFADRICAALERDTPVVTDDFDKLVERYAWQANLDRLVETMDRLIPSG